MADITPEEMARRLALAVRQYNDRNPHKPITEQDFKDRSGFVGKMMLAGEGLWNGLTRKLPADMAAMARAGDVGNDKPSDRIIADSQAAMAERVPSRQEALGDEDAISLYNSASDLPTNMVTGLPGAIAGGMAGAPGGVLGAIAGTSAGSAATTYGAYYRIAKDRFMQDMHEQFRRETGRELTRPEMQELGRLVDSEARAYSHDQATKEAIAQGIANAAAGGAGRFLMKLGMPNMLAKEAARPRTGIHAAMVAGENVGNEALSPERNTNAEEIFRSLNYRPQDRALAAASAGLDQLRW